MPLPVPGAGTKNWGHGVRGLASPDALLGAIPWCAVPQIMEEVEVIQHVPTAGEQIVVCLCHRSCRYVEVASLCGVLPQVQFLDKVVDMPVASNARCLMSSVQKTAASAVAVLTLEVDVPVVQVVAWVSCWRRFPTVQTVQKTGEIPQVLFLDTVETPVVVQRQVLGLRQCRKLWNFRSCSAVKVVDVPVYAGRRRYGRRCDHAASSGLLLEVPQFSSSPEFVDFPVCTETGGFQ